MNGHAQAKMNGGRLTFLEAGLILITVALPIPFGSLHAWSFMSAAAWVYLLLFLHPEALTKFFDLPRLFRWGMLFIFLAVLLQAAFFSMNRAETLVTLLFTLAVWAGFLLFQLLPHDGLLGWCRALAVLGVAESVYGLWQVGMPGREMVLWQQKIEHEGFVTGTYFNRNHMAGLLELCLGVHLGLCLGAYRRQAWKELLFWGASWFVVMTAFLKTGSRMGMISYFLSLAIFAYYFREKLKKEIRGTRIFAFITLLAFLAAAWFSRNVLFSRFLGLPHFFLRGEGRFLVWRDVLGMIRDHTWLGTGLGTFAWVFPFYQSDALWTGWAHAHNDYLELAAGLGIVSFLVLMISFGWFGARVLKNLSRLDSANFLIGWGILISITSLLFHGIMDFNFAIPANACLWVFLTGLSWKWLRAE